MRIHWVAWCVCACACACTRVYMACVCMCVCLHACLRTTCVACLRVLGMKGSYRTTEKMRVEGGCRNAAEVFCVEQNSLGYRGWMEGGEALWAMSLWSIITID